MSDENKQPPAKSPLVWPPAPTQQTVLSLIKPERQEWSYLTGYLAGDLVLGLLAGPVTHFVCWAAFLSIAQAIDSTQPTPVLVWYGSWVFAVVVAAAMVLLFLRRYRALTSGFVISAVLVAAVNLFMMWFGAGIGGAVD